MANTQFELLLKIALQSNRRAFLKYAGLGGVALAAGCGDDDMMLDAALDADAGTDADAMVDGSVDAPQTMFDVFRGLQSSLRKSPDHLPERAKALIASADAEAIFEFVRDEIAVYPTSATRVVEIFTKRLFGSRATLRGGAGSPRDKVELLREMYEQAGFSARTVQGRVVEAHADLRSWLLRPIPRNFDPQVDDATLNLWLETMGVDPAAAIADPIDKDKIASKQLADRLWPMIEDNSNNSSFAFDFRWGDRLPLVAVTVGNEELFACPLIPSAMFGESCVREVSELTEAQAVEEERVTVRVEGVSSANPTERFTLVEGEWAQEELLGRQLLVGFTPGMSMLQWINSQFVQAPFFVPSLSVQALDLDEPNDDFTFVGDAFTHAGNRLSADSDGTVSVDQTVIYDPSNLGDASQVATIEELTIDAGRFETVSLRFTAKDSSGTPVNSLTGGDISVLEDGEPMPFLLSSTRPEPRVLVTVDQSLSMPRIWRNDNAAENFAQSLGEDITAVYSGATSTLATRNNSNLWQNLANAVHTNPTILVYVTDGDISDSSTPEIEATLRSGPPIVIVQVEGTEPLQTLVDIATRSNGVVVLAEEQNAASEAVLGFLAAYSIPSYALSYQAPSTGNSTRQVSVSIVGQDPQVMGSYEVPAETNSARLSGLYLTIDMSGTSVTRTLAGRHHEARTTDAFSATAADDVLSVLHSTVTLNFEGATPQRSVWLDDVLEGKLSHERMYDALLGDDDEELLAALDAGVAQVPFDSLSVMPAYQRDATTQSMTFETAARAVLSINGPAFGTNTIAQRLDVFRFGPPSSVIDADATARLEATFRQTAQLAVAESALHETSTLSALSGVPLVVASGATHFTSNEELSAEERAQWRRVMEEYPRYTYLVPESGSPMAFWAIERNTGSLLGVLQNGSGGAETYVQIEQTIDEIMTIIRYLEMVSNAGRLIPHPAGGAIRSLGGPAKALGMTLVRYFATATLLVASLDAYNVPPIFRRDLLATACQTLQKIAPGPVFEQIASTSLAALILGEPSMCIES